MEGRLPRLPVKTIAELKRIAINMAMQDDNKGKPNETAAQQPPPEQVAPNPPGQLLLASQAVNVDVNVNSEDVTVPVSLGIPGLKDSPEEELSASLKSLQTLLSVFNQQSSANNLYVLTRRGKKLGELLDRHYSDIPQLSAGELGSAQIALSVLSAIVEHINHAKVPVNKVSEPAEQLKYFKQRLEMVCSQRNEG